jgi:hypothetical protein
MKKNRKQNRSTDDLLNNVCVIFNTTWPEADTYRAQAAARFGLGIEEFDELAEDVKLALLRGEDHPRAGLVHAVQQEAFRVKETELDKAGDAR